MLTAKPKPRFTAEAHERKARDLRQQAAHFIRRAEAHERWIRKNYNREET